MADKDVGRKNCDKLIGLFRAYGFVDYLVFNNGSQVNAYVNNGDTITFMCRSEKILCHTINEAGIRVMKWCGETGIPAFLRKLGIDYHEKGEVEEINLIDYIEQQG